MMEALLTKLSFVVSIVLQVLILTILIRRRLRKRFFWFFVYILFEICESLIRLAASGNQVWYLRVYWTTEVADVVFFVAAMRESFLNVFWPYTRLRWFTRLVWGGIGLALLYAVFKAWAFPPIESNGAIDVIIGVEVAVNYSLSVVGILYLALIVFLKVRKHHWESAVVLGFTVNATVASFGFLTRSVFGTRFNTLSSWLSVVAYMVGEIIWVLGLWRPEPEVQGPRRDPTDKDLETLDRHIAILDRILKRNG